MALFGRLLFQSFKHRELGRCQGAEAAVWSQVIVILTPCGDDRVPTSPNQNFGAPGLTTLKPNDPVHTASTPAL